MLDCAKSSEPTVRSDIRCSFVAGARLARNAAVVLRASFCHGYKSRVVVGHLAASVGGVAADLSTQAAPARRWRGTVREPVRPRGRKISDLTDQRLDRHQTAPAWRRQPGLCGS